MSTKICPKCNRDKPLIVFSKSKKIKSDDGYTMWCTFCLRTLRWQKVIEKVKRKEKGFVANDITNPFAKYNITKDDYKIMYKEQNGVCKICRQPETTRANNGRFRSLSIDHCHKTGKVRGLLCHSCNLSLGLLKDDIKILEAAIRYLKENQ